MRSELLTIALLTLPVPAAADIPRGRFESQPGAAAAATYGQLESCGGAADRAVREVAGTIGWIEVGAGWLNAGFGRWPITVREPDRIGASSVFRGPPHERARWSVMVVAEGRSFNLVVRRVLVTGDTACEDAANRPLKLVR